MSDHIEKLRQDNAAMERELRELRTHVAWVERERDECERRVRWHEDIAAHLVQRSNVDEVPESISKPPSAHWRPFVLVMAEAMEGQLRANDHKSGEWGSLDEVFTKLIEEVHELKEASRWMGSNTGGDTKILMEAADVANVAGMIVSFLADKMPSVNTGVPD